MEKIVKNALFSDQENIVIEKMFRECDQEAKYVHNGTEFHKKRTEEIKQKRALLEKIQSMN